MREMESLARNALAVGSGEAGNQIGIARHFRAADLLQQKPHSAKQKDPLKDVVALTHIPKQQSE